MVQQIEVNDRVQLTHDVPELGLHRGDQGLVCSTWFWPTETYEVEFGLSSPGDEHLRALLMISQIEPAGCMVAAL
jgi:hypothetical protein